MASMFDPKEFSQGEILPSVKPADLAKTLKLVADYARRAEDSGQLSADAVGWAQFKMVASPDADVGAVWFRAVLLHFALKHGKFTDFQDQAELREDFLRLWASFPFRAVNTKPNGEFSLNENGFEETVRQLRNPPES